MMKLQAERAGTGILLLGCASLLALMLYILRLDPAGATSGAAEGRALAAVVLPGRDDWLDLVRAADECRNRGLLRELASRGDTLDLLTRGGNRLRLVWTAARGEVETRTRVSRMSREPALMAVIGSDNTASTAALARALRRTFADTATGPALLIPWATATRVPGLHGGEPIPLMRIYPGHSFRFCPDNAQIAELVARCVTRQIAPARLDRAWIIADPRDPYSTDLAEGFALSLKTHAPETPVIAWTDASFSGADDRGPSPEADALARRIWLEARRADPAQTLGVVLPLQGEPTRRLLSALRNLAPTGPRPALHILCGDGVGVDDLKEYQGPGTPFAVWCFTSDLGLLPGPVSETRENQVLVEILTAFVTAIDQGATNPESVRLRLSQLDLTRGRPETLGRPLRFVPEGERDPEGLGAVLATRARGTGLVLLEQGPEGAWIERQWLAHPTSTALARP